LHSSAERGQLVRANSRQTSSVSQRESLPAVTGAAAAGLIMTAPASDGVTDSIAQSINLIIHTANHSFNNYILPPPFTDNLLLLHIRYVPYIPGPISTR